MNNDTAVSNPLLQDWNTPFSIAPFDLIRPGHFKPAVEYAIEEARKEVDLIIYSGEVPDFHNTIEALESAGALLSRITPILFNLNSSDTTPPLQTAAREVTPLLTVFANDITLNARLFLKVKEVFDRRDNLDLDAEQLILLDRRYKGFVRGGAALSDAGKEKFRTITVEMSTLSLKFEENLLAETNDFTLHLTSEDDLAGLPDGMREAAAGLAREREMEGWVFTLHAPSYVPFMQYSDRRDLREKMFRAYTRRSYRGNDHDNRVLVTRIADLRLQLARLLGFTDYASYALEENDIVFSRVGSVDRNSLISPKEKGWLFSGRLLRVRPKGEKVFSPFLSYQFHSNPFKNRVRSVAVGQTMASLNTQILKDIAIFLPSLPEQTAIAAALSDADALIAALDILIAKKWDIKQGAMQELLTGEKRLPGFEGEWEVKRLGDLAAMNSGGTPSTSVPQYYDGNIPWVSIADMTKCGKYISSTERNLTENGLVNSSAMIFPIGTVLYAMYASIGECSIANTELCSSQAILGIRTKKNLNNQYLYYYFVAKKEEIKATGQHGTQANLNGDLVKNLRILLPPLPEQTAIASILSDMDTEIAALEQKRDKALMIKEGMMKELLTGRTRLV